MKKNSLKLLATFLLVVVTTFLTSYLLLSKNVTINPQKLIASLILALSFTLTLQGLLTLTWMLYAWENPENADQHKSPKIFRIPQLSFTALVPARHEEKVIQDTILAVNNINYPENLKETILLCRNDDKQTIAKAYEIIKRLNKNNVKLITFDGFPINKPFALNVGLAKSSKDVVAIFDAEDEPNKDIYNVINTVMLENKVDVIQSGV